MIASSAQIYKGIEDDDASTHSFEDVPIKTLSDFKYMTGMTINAKVSETYKPLFATSNQSILQGDVYAADMWIENEIRKAVEQTHKHTWNDSEGQRNTYFDLNSATDDAMLAYNRNNADRSQFSAGEVNVNGLCVRDFADVDDTDDGPHPVQLTQVQRLLRRMGVGHVLPSLARFGTPQDDQQKQSWGNKIYSFLLQFFTEDQVIPGYDKRRLAAKVTGMILNHFETEWELYEKFENDEEYRRSIIEEAVDNLKQDHNLRKQKTENFLKQENENTRKVLSNDANAIALCGVDVLIHYHGEPVKYLEIVTIMPNKLDKSEMKCVITFNENLDVLSELDVRHKQIIDKIVLKAALSVYVDSLYKIMLQNHHPYASEFIMKCNLFSVLQEVMYFLTSQHPTTWSTKDKTVTCQMQHLRDICLGLSLGFAQQGVNFGQNLQQAAASWTDPKKRENTAPLPPGNAWWNAIQTVHQQNTSIRSPNNRNKQQQSMLISENGVFTVAGFRCLLGALANDDYKVYDLLTHTDEEQMVWNLFSTCAIQETEYQIALLLASIRYNIHQFMQRLLDPKSNVSPENIDMQSIETLNKYVLSLGAGGVLRQNLQKKIQFDPESNEWNDIESSSFALPSTDCLAPHQDIHDSVTSSTQRIQEKLNLLRGIFDETYPGSINELWQDDELQQSEHTLRQYVQSIRHSFLDYITTPAARAVLRLCCASQIPNSNLVEMEWWTDIKNQTSVSAESTLLNTIENGMNARQKFAQYAWKYLVKTSRNKIPDDLDFRDMLEFIANRHMEYMCLLQAFTLQFKMAIEKYAAQDYADYDATFDAFQQTRSTAMGIGDANPTQIAHSDFMYFVQQNNHNFDRNGHDIPFACMVCILSKQAVREWILYKHL